MLDDSRLDSGRTMLNLGCGTTILPAYINMDVADLSGVDVVHDANLIPWPFSDSHFDEILCTSFLEHVDLVTTLREAHRVLKPTGKMLITVPHFTSVFMYRDPTHKNFFSHRTFDFFTKDSQREYYFDFCFESISELKIDFHVSLIFFYNPFVKWLVNLSRRMMDFYESSPLRVFPATNIKCTFVK